MAGNARDMPAGMAKAGVTTTAAPGRHLRAAAAVVTEGQHRCSDSAWHVGKAALGGGVTGQPKRQKVAKQARASQVSSTAAHLPRMQEARSVGTLRCQQLAWHAAQALDALLLRHRTTCSNHQHT
jgi:hypothetical protein